MDEEIIIPIVVFSFFLLLVWMILNFLKWRIQHKQQQPEGSSLRTSELKALMREAVEEANQPLLERIEQLEEDVLQAAAPRLTPAPQDRQEGAALKAPDEEPAPASRRVT